MEGRMIISLPRLPLSKHVTPSKTLTLISTKRSSSPLENFLLRSIAGALAFTFLSSPPLPSLAITTKPLDHSSTSISSTELCVEEQGDELIEEEKPSESITNEDLVEEAWEIVNESYIGGDVGTRPWNSRLWKERKEYIFNGNNMQSRSRAHDVIQKMLASLGDPFTRFLSPAEFSKMARYDVTGIGINLREIPDVNGAVKLKVLGIILDGPAHSAGVRQDLKQSW